MDSISKFTGKAETYEKFRPAYPAGYLEYLVKENGLRPESIVADIGSGTGILTRQLLEQNLKVIAVEPNMDMRKTAERELARYTGFSSVDGTAEDTGLPGESLDLITVAQAFHWFDPDRFKTECRRILKPQAKVALVWNSRDAESPMVMEAAAVCRKFCRNFKGFSGGKEETPETARRFFRDETYEFTVFRHDLAYNREGFIGRNLSASYAPRREDPDYPAFVDALSELFAKYSVNGRIEFPNITRSYLGKV